MLDLAPMDPARRDVSRNTFGGSYFAPTVPIHKAMPHRLATLVISGLLFAWPAGAGASTPERPDVPLVAPAVAALATLAPEIADWPDEGEQPGSAPRAIVRPRDEPIWVMTTIDVCATQRRVTVEFYSSLAADVALRVYYNERTLARTRVPQAIRERTATLATPELRRGRSYWVEVAAQRPDDTYKERRRLIVRSACG